MCRQDWIKKWQLILKGKTDRFVSFTSSRWWIIWLLFCWTVWGISSAVVEAWVVFVPLALLILAPEDLSDPHRNCRCWCWDFHHLTVVFHWTFSTLVKDNKRFWSRADRDHRSLLGFKQISNLLSGNLNPNLKTAWNYNPYISKYKQKQGGYANTKWHITETSFRLFIQAIRISFQAF